jgi:hypothetical protein
MFVTMPATMLIAQIVNASSAIDVGGSGAATEIEVSGM